MFDFASLLDVAAPAAGLVAVIVLVRAVAGSEPSDAGSMLPNPAAMPWPRGVQEDEPIRFRLDRLDRRAGATAPVPLGVTSLTPAVAPACECAIASDAA